MSASGKCGTYAGFRHHRRYKQPICQACRVADALYKQDRRMAPKRRQVLLEALAGFDGRTYRRGAA
jgi:hypothetical protein